MLKRRAPELDETESGVEWFPGLRAAATSPRRCPIRYPVSIARLISQIFARGRRRSPDEVGQLQVNERVWGRGGFVRSYARTELHPAEETLFALYERQLGGRVLELGSGAGRLSRHLIRLGADLHGIDISSDMVAHCRRHIPAGTFEVGDLRRLAAHGGGAYDAVVAGANVLDVLDDAERRRVLLGIGRVLKPSGLLVMSSHNRAFLSRVPPATRLPSPRNPMRFAAAIARLPSSIYHSRKLKPLERSEARYAIVNDEAHEYRLLHYYITRDEQERQFSETGFALERCVDALGRELEREDDAPESSELHYAARAAAMPARTNL